MSKRQVTWTHTTFQSIPIRAQNGDILRVVIKSSCLSQLQALGPCMSHLEVHRGVHCRGKRPLLALSPLAAGQSRQEPAPAFSPKAWLAFQNVSQHNEPLVCLSSLKLLPEQRDSRTSHGCPHQLPSVPAGWVAQGTEPGWHSSSECSFIWGIIQENILCSHPERISHPKFNNFSSQK